MIAARVVGRSSRFIAAATTSGTPRIAATATLINSHKPINIVRPLTSSTKLYKEDKSSASDKSAAATALEGDAGHEGSFSRTDNKVTIEYPEEHELPPSTPVQGRGGLHFKRTLASFTLEGKVVVVTGGARGLGLVMSQAAVISGADVAIVDLNSELNHLLLRGYANYDLQRRKVNVKPKS